MLFSVKLYTDIPFFLYPQKFGNIFHKQIIKGILFLLVEIGYIYYMITSGIGHLSLLPSLGWLTQEEVWNEAKGIYEYILGHQSIQILLYGVITIALSVLFIVYLRACIKSAYKAQCLHKEGKHVNNFIDDLKALTHENLQKSLMAIPLTGIFASGITQHPIVFKLTLFGLVLAVGRIFDAITDPIIGALMDRTNGKFGKFRPFMVTGGLFALTVVSGNAAIAPVLGTGLVTILNLIGMMVIGLVIDATGFLGIKKKRP